MHIKAYAILCVVIVLSMGFFSYKKWQEYSLAKEAVSVNKGLIEALRDGARDEMSVYTAKKDGFNNLNKEIEEKLSYIFPLTDDYTALTRQLDSFEVELSKKDNIFEVSSIDYQSIADSNYYSVLPFRMNQIISLNFCI